MKFFAWTLVIMGGIIFLGAGLVSVAAFSDARHVCPGNQCSDAISVGSNSGVTAFLALVGAMSAFLYLRAKKTSSKPLEPTSDGSQN